MRWNSRALKAIAFATIPNQIVFEPFPSLLLIFLLDFYLMAEFRGGESSASGANYDELEQRARTAHLEHVLG